MQQVQGDSKLLSVFPFIGLALRRGADKSLAYKENNKLRIRKNVFTLHIPLWAPHTYGFVVLTSLNHPRKNLLFVLQVGN
jgi:hypothetical protein